MPKENEIGQALQVTTGKESDVLTMEKLLEAMELMNKHPCPFASFMIERGCDPKDGWRMMIPTSKNPFETNFALPGYVRLSHLIDKPALVKVKPMYDGHGIPVMGWGLR